MDWAIINRLQLFNEILQRRHVSGIKLQTVNVKQRSFERCIHNMPFKIVSGQISNTRFILNTIFKSIIVTSYSYFVVQW